MTAGNHATPDDATRDRWQRIDAIFTALLDLPSAQRDAAVEHYCRGDPTLAADVRRLLDAERRSASVFDAAAASIQQFAERALAAQEEEEALPESVQQIGPYRLTKRIGTGGMSVVWKAERNDGEFQQTVAVKLLRRWVESDETVQRFREERRILARLEHPNLARLLDGGVLAQGWPYFLMEHVEGVPVTAYCDTHRLTIDQRLTLFTQILDVVQYAHRRLVVHRDLKPSNILVTAAGQVKLLDFGIAKVLDRELASVGESELTQVSGRPMTLAYASPEQVIGEPVSVASDVYALGVLLYELLTGRSPYACPLEQSMALREAVLTQAPANPSQRVLAMNGDGIAPAELATRRATTPAGLYRQLRGDLDVICQVALRKEPEHRYATVEHLRADLARYRQQLPVLARAGNWRYRAGRFARRHTWGLAAGILVPISVIAGLLLHAERLGTERDRAEVSAQQAQQEAAKARQVTDYLVSLFRSADPAQSGGREITAAALVERGVLQTEALTDDPALQAAMFRVLGQVKQALGQYQRAGELLQRALSTLDLLHDSAAPDRADILADMGFTYFQLGRLQEAEQFNRQALAELPADAMLRRAPVLTNLGIVNILTSRYDAALTLLQDAVGAHEAAAPGSAEHATTLNALGTLLSRQGRHEEATTLLRAAVSMRYELFGEQHPATSVALGNLGTVLHESGDYAAAEPYLQQALTIDRALLGDDHPSLAVLLNQLAGTRRELGDLSGAIGLLSEALAILRREVDAQSPALAVALSGLGMAHLYRGDIDDADRFLAEAVAIEENVLGPISRELAIDLMLLGQVRVQQQRLDDAELLYDRGLAIGLALFGEQHQLVATALKNLAELYRLQGNSAQALAAGHRSLRIASDLFGADHPEVTALRAWIAALDGDAGAAAAGSKALQ